MPYIYDIKPEGAEEGAYQPIPATSLEGDLDGRKVKVHLEVEKDSSLSYPAILFYSWFSKIISFFSSIGGKVWEEQAKLGKHVVVVFERDERIPSPKASPHTSSSLPNSSIPASPSSPPSPASPLSLSSPSSLAFPSSTIAIPSAAAVLPSSSLSSPKSRESSFDLQEQPNLQELELAAELTREPLLAQDERSALIAQTMAYPAPPLQKMPIPLYGNIVGLFGAEIKKGALEGEKLEGLDSDRAFSYLIEVHRAYLTGLWKLGESEATKAERAKVERSLDKFQQGLNLTRELHGDRKIFHRSLSKQVLNLKPGENLFFGGGWRGVNEPGHAIVYEIERQSDQRLTLRLFNLGAGSEFHSQQFIGLEGKVLPYTEFIDVVPEDLLRQTTVDFLVSLRQNVPEIEPEWRPEDIYHVLLPVLGGGIPTNTRPLESLRSPQYVGNCAIASSVAMMDKMMETSPLASRMRFFTLARATEHFYSSYKDLLPREEGYRRLLLKGCKSTLEAAEQALLEGGFNGKELQPLLQKLRAMQAEVLNLHDKDLKIPDRATLELSTYSTWEVATATSVASFEDFEHRALPPAAADERVGAANPDLGAPLTPLPPTEWRAPINNPDHEATIYEPAKAGAVRGVRRREEQNEAVILTPFEIPALLRQGTEFMRDFMDLGRQGPIQASDALAYFKGNLPHLLEKEYLELFTEQLQTPGAIERAFESDEHFAEALVNFFESARTFGHLIQDPLMRSFLAYLGRSSFERVREAARRMGKELPVTLEGNKHFSEIIHELQGSGKGLQLAHYFRVRSFEAHRELKAEEAGELLSSYNYLIQNGLPASLEKERYGWKELKDIVQLRRGQLYNLLSDEKNSQVILNQIVQGVDPDFRKVQWNRESESIFTCSEPVMRYDLRTGVLERSLVGTVLLPQRIADNSLFKALIPHPPEKILAIDPYTYEYKGDEGVRYRFRVKGEHVIIQRQLAGIWVQATLKSPISNLPFHHEEEPIKGIFWMGKLGVSGRQPFFYQSIAGAGSWLRIFWETSQRGWRASEYGSNASQDNKLAASNPLVERVEDPKFSLLFHDQQGLSKVVLPRFGLTLERSRAGVLSSKHLEGFGLVDKKEAYFSVMGDFHQYLPLYRGNERAVLIPKASLLPQKGGVLTTPTALEKLPASWGSKAPYFLYKLEQGKLIPIANSAKEQIEANIYLATLLLSEQRYEEAREALTAADRAIKVLGEALPVEILQALYNLSTFDEANADPAADAVALRLYAASCLLWHESMRYAPGRAPILDPKKLNEEYLSYLNHLERTTESMHLRPGEERLLQSVIINSKEGTPPLIAIRQQMLIGSKLRPLIPELPQGEIPIEKWRLLEKEKASRFSIVGRSPEPVAIGHFSHPSQAVVTRDPFLMKAFPEKILPLYSILRATEEVGEIPTSELAKQFGLPENLSRKQLRIELKTLLELRYRHLSVTVQKDPEQEVNYGEEIDILRLLLYVARQGTAEKTTRELEEKFVTHGHALGTLGFLANRTGHTELYGEASEAALTEAKKLWGEWVIPRASLLPPQTIQQIAINKPIPGPSSVGRIVEPERTAQEEAAFNKPISDFDRAYQEMLKKPLSALQFLQVERTPVAPVASPFTGFRADKRLVRSVFEEYQKQFVAYTNSLPQNKEKYQVSDPAAVASLIRNLKVDEQAAKERIAQTEEELLSLANALPSDPNRRALLFSKQARGAWRQITLKDLKIAVARGWDGRDLRKLNPDLSSEQIRTLLHKTAHYLLEVRQEQRLSRALTAGEATQKEGFKDQGLLEGFKKALSEKLEYDPFKEPFLLLAETEFNIALWKEQLPAILNLGREKQLSTLVELAMGLGKTDVISPTVLAVLADGKTLPILIMPQALLPSMAVRLQERMGVAYDREVRVLPIERRPRTGAEIRQLTEELRTMIEQRTPLVWSAEDMQTVVNSFLEEMENPAQEANKHAEACKAWQELFSLLRTSGVILGDELHALLDILTSYHFTLGNPKPVSVDERDAVAHFTNLLLSSHTASALNSLTEDNFKKQVAPRLISKILQEGITGDPRAIEWIQTLSTEQKNILVNYLQGSPGVTKKQVEALMLKKSDLLPSDKKEIGFLQQRNPQLAAAIRKGIETKNEELTTHILNFLAVQKESLRTVFVLTATAQFGKHYALNREGEEAIPAEEGIPQWDSLFGSPLERLYYTLFAFMKTGISQEVVRKDLEEMTDTLRKEVSGREIDEKEWEKHPLVLQFREKYGTALTLKLSPYKDEEIKELTDWVNDHPKSQVELIRAHIFPEVKIYPKQIESSTHLFALIARKVGGMRGMSGTFFNRATFPDVFGRTLLSTTIHEVTERLKRTSPQEVRLLPLKADPKEQLEALANVQQLAPGSIIDTTGHFSKVKMGEFSRDMLDRLPARIQGIAYYEGNELKVAERDREESVLYDKERNPEALAAIWDVSHTTGSDIRLGKEMTATLVVGKHIKLYQLAQAAMRMRGLGKGQQVEVMVVESDYPLIRQMLQQHLGITLAPNNPLTLDHLLRYALLNELLQESENNFRAIEMRMRMALMDPIMELLWNPKGSSADADRIYELCRSLFIQEQAGDSWSSYGSPIYKEDTEKAKKQLLGEWKGHPAIQSIKSNPHLFPGVNLAEVYKRWEQILGAEAGALADEVEVGSKLGSKQRTEAKVQQKVAVRVRQQEQTTVQVKTVKKIKGKVGVPTKLRRALYQSRKVVPAAADPFKKTAQQPLPLVRAAALTDRELQRAGGALVRAEEILKLDPSLDAIRLEEPNLFLSLNLAPMWRTVGESAPVFAPYQYFHKYPKHALLIQDKTTGQLSLKLLDQNDVKQLIPQLKQDDGKGDLKLALYHLQGDRILCSGKEKLDPKLFNPLLVKAKFLSGITHFTEEQKPALDSWLERIDAKKMAQAFLKGVARQRGDTVETFHRSVLAKRLAYFGASEVLNPIPPRVGLEGLEALFFDSTLSGKDLLEKLEDFKWQHSDKWPELVEGFAPYLTPLLALKYPASAEDQTVRQWIMREFFPYLENEYLAWKTAVPALHVNEGELSSSTGWFRAFQSFFVGAKDGIATHLLKLETQSPPLSQDKSVASVAQLENMSELADPLLGLPKVVYRDDRAILIARKAMETVDFVSSLKQKEVMEITYPCEELRGLFSFLGRQQLEAPARCDYGFLAARRLFTGKIRTGVGFAKFLEQDVFTDVTSVTPERLKKELDKFLELTKGAPAPREMWDYIKFLEAFTLKGSPQQVAALAEWTNDAMKKMLAARSGSWVLHALIIQLLRREEPLLDHKTLGDYYPSSVCSTSPERIRLGNLGLDKTHFDFMVWATDTKTKNAPPYALADVARLFEENIDFCNTNLLERILPKFLSILPKDTVLEPALKARLERIIQKIEAKGGAAHQVYFQEQLVDPLRLAVRFTRDPAERRRILIADLTNVFTTSREPMLVGFLERRGDPSTLSPEEVRGLLNLFETSNYYQHNELMDKLLDLGNPAKKEAVRGWARAAIHKRSLHALLHYCMQKLPFAEWEGSTLSAHWNGLQRFPDKVAFIEAHISFWRSSSLLSAVTGCDFEFVADVHNLQYIGKRPLSTDAIIKNIKKATPLWPHIELLKKYQNTLQTGYLTMECKSDLRELIEGIRRGESYRGENASLIKVLEDILLPVQN